MPKKFVARAALIILVAFISALAACSGGKPYNPVTPSIIAKENTGRIKATWITADTEGNNLLIPLTEVKKNIIIHFMLETLEGKMPFMAYEFEKKIYVRANICPPCRSYNFSLEKDILICDTCATRFEARTGDGISGYCFRFPKAAVTWETRGDKLMMGREELLTAYFSTLEAGLP